jgi:hypothetical protein
MKDEDLDFRPVTIQSVQSAVEQEDAEAIVHRILNHGGVCEGVITRRVALDTNRVTYTVNRKKLGPSPNVCFACELHTRCPVIDASITRKTALKPAAKLVEAKLQ